MHSRKELALITANLYELISFFNDFYVKTVKTYQKIILVAVVKSTINYHFIHFNSIKPLLQYFLSCTSVLVSFDFMLMFTLGS